MKAQHNIFKTAIVRESGKIILFNSILTFRCYITTSSEDD